MNLIDLLVLIFIHNTSYYVFQSQDIIIEKKENIKSAIKAVVFYIVPLFVIGTFKYDIYDLSLFSLSVGIIYGIIDISLSKIAIKRFNSENYHSFGGYYTIIWIRNTLLLFNLLLNYKYILC